MELNKNNKTIKSKRARIIIVHAYASSFTKFIEKSLLKKSSGKQYNSQLLIIIKHKIYTYL